MKRDRESIYVHLSREIGRILEGRISAEASTDLDGVLWKLADELADKPTADVVGMSQLPSEKLPCGHSRDSIRLAPTARQPSGETVWFCEDCRRAAAS